MKVIPRYLRLAAAIVWLAMFSGQSSAATLIGDQVQFVVGIGGSSSVINQLLDVVTPGIEYEDNHTGRQNIEATSIFVDWNIEFLGGVGFDSNNDRFSYFDLDWTDAPGVLTGFTLTTNIAGLDDSRVTFGDDFISVQLAGLSVIGAASDVPFSQYQLDLQVSQVPVPPALILFASGLLGLTGMGRCKRS